MRETGIHPSTVLRSLVSVAAGLVLGALPSVGFAQVCPTAVERAVADLYNQERVFVGLPPLTIDVRLVQSARGHSQDMAFNNFFDHVGSGGSTFDQTIILTSAGEWTLFSAPQLLSAVPTVADDAGGAVSILGYVNGATHEAAR